MFGIPRPGRFLPKSSGTKLWEAAAPVAPRSGGATTPVVIDGVEWKSLGEEPLDEGAAATYDDLFTRTPDHDRGPMTLSDAAEHLSRATSRDDVAKTILDFLSHSSGTVALMIVKDGLVRGWQACSEHRKLRGFEEFSSPLASFPELQQCVVTGRPYIGDAAAPETKLLLQRLHSAGERPAFFPISIQQRGVAVLLCDASERLNPVETAELCRKVSYALEILILRSKLLG